MAKVYRKLGLVHNLNIMLILNFQLSYSNKGHMKHL